MASRRPQSRGEEIANSISHGVALIGVLTGVPFLILNAARHGDTGYLVGVCIFSAGMALLYLASSLYHALPPGRAKRVFWVVDHSAIFLLIAGTYTPFTLGILRGPWGWTLFGLVWGIALSGVALKAFSRISHPVVSTGLYIFLGWLVVIAIHPLYQRVPLNGLLWLLAGGLAYTGGVVFYVSSSRMRYGHFIWHVFVMSGTVCHYIAVLRYAL